jgi:ribonuclease HII
MPRPRATRSLENLARRLGFVHVAGVDEVGRGCLAGPVLAGAVILDPDRPIGGLRDSKLLTAAERERLHDEILGAACAWAVGVVDVAGIDRWNIHQASLRAMRQAVLALVPLPDLVLVDAFRVADLPMAQQAVIHGDRLSSAIAAASIVAKVTRDRLMTALHATDPRYGFDRHKGYATAEHLAAVARHGYSAAHRRTFRPPSLFDRME